MNATNVRNLSSYLMLGFRTRNVPTDVPLLSMVYMSSFDLNKFVDKDEDPNTDERQGLTS